MLRKPIKYLIACSLWVMPCLMEAQNDITNAFDDLKRQGTMNEQDSEMRRAASPEVVSKILQEFRVSGFFRLAGGGVSRV